MNPRMSSPRRVACCITGWHFPRDIFNSRWFPAGIDIYLLSHRVRADIPDYVSEIVPDERILIEPNYGYDWGCYQQFLERVDVSVYDIVVFMHDDVTIRSAAVFDKAFAMLESLVIIGVKGSGIRDYTEVLTPAIIAHMDYIPPKEHLAYPIVRGSFFAIRGDALAEIGSIPVFWDKFHIDIAYGNHSLNAFCYLVARRYGHAAFGYLEDQCDPDELIVEWKRGGKVSQSIGAMGIHREGLLLANVLIRGLFRRVASLRVYLAWRGIKFLDRPLLLLLSVFSGRPGNGRLSARR